MSTSIVPTTEELDAIRRERYLKASARLQQWSSEDRTYDERIGQLLEEELKDSQLRCEDCDESRA